MINARIAQIDHLVSLQLNQVMHAPEFQKLEGSWRGLQYLLDNSETSTMLKIRVLNVSKKDLLRDLQKAPEFDQSAMFKKVYEEEYGVFGGEPFGALIGDYEFGKHPEDIELLEKVSNVAAAAHAPFLTAADASLLNLDSFTNLGQPRDLAKIFDSTEYAKWKSFRQSEDSRYVGLCVPHILMRLPYGKDTKPVDGFNYEEGVDGTDHSKYLWGNAAYALGARLTRHSRMYGWCAAIRGVEGGGLVEGLPAHNFRTDEGDVALKCPDRNRHHRPPRERTGGPGIRSAGALQEHRLRGLLQRAVRAEAEAVRQGGGQRQRAAVDPVAVHPGRIAVRALSEGHDARQDRQLHVSRGVRTFSEPLDHTTTSSRTTPPAGHQSPAVPCAKREWK